jgi:hypothetical protein
MKFNKIALLTGLLMAANTATADETYGYMQKVLIPDLKAALNSN